MKVFIIVCSAYDEYDILGVHSTLEKAQAEVANAFDNIKAQSNDKYSYELVNDNYDEYNYSVYRNKTHEFSDGLVDRIYIETYSIVEREVV